jgi:hypothetical protein
MSRPIYETDEDREQELAVATAFAAKCDGWSAHQLPRLAPVDVAFTCNGCLAAFAEIKCRNIKLSKYPTLILSVAKVGKMEALRALVDVPIYLIAHLEDFTMTMAVQNIAPNCEQAMGGRGDRGDPADMEMVYHIPWALFPKRDEHGGLAPPAVL